MYMRKIYHYLLSFLSYIFYGRPSRRLVVIGVTGTKGKSTTCRFIANVLQAGGYKVGLLSTVEFQVGEKRWLNKRKMTMLGRGEIHKMLRAMVRAGCQYAVVETSSEGILQYRHKFLNYDIAVFTNLGTEHSERHGGFENLRSAKGELFAALARHPKVINGQKIKKVIVVNTDDANAEYYLNFAADEKIGYGLKKVSSIKYQVLWAEIEKSEADGSVFKILNTKYTIHIPGQFNIPNAQAAIAVGRSQNISEEKIRQGIESVKLVEGRMEFIDEGQPFRVIVDYAHEPMSLTELFTAVRKMLPSGGRSITLVGSDGGGRDVGKRAKMGAIAGQLCDIVIVTDVNCFDEDPRAIAEMLAVGARQAGKKDDQNLFIEIDRQKAIALAVKMAQPGDVITITAKGTEPCICVANGQKVPWDDRDAARVALGAWKTGAGVV